MTKPAITLLGLLALLVPGCAAAGPTKKAAGVVGRSAVTVAKTTGKVVTWPYREYKASQAGRQEHPKTFTLGLNDTPVVDSPQMAEKTPKDSNVKVAGADSSDEDSPPTRRSSRKKDADLTAEADEDDAGGGRSSRKRLTSKVDDVELASAEDDSDSPPPRKKKAAWKGKTATVAADSDPDTIRIE